MSEQTQPDVDSSRRQSLPRRVLEGILLAGEERIGMPPEVAAEIHRKEEIEAVRIEAETQRRDQSDMGVH